MSALSTCQCNEAEHKFALFIAKMSINDVSSIALTQKYLLKALAPSTHVSKHHGSTNKKLRCHLPLKVPKYDKNTGPSMPSFPSISSSSKSSLPTSTSFCWLRVADQIVELEEGVAVVFDDSFEHEAANEHPTQPRVVLVVDFWHPDFDDEEVRTSSIDNVATISHEP